MKNETTLWPLVVTLWAAAGLFPAVVKRFQTAAGAVWLAGLLLIMWAHSVEQKQGEAALPVLGILAIGVAVTACLLWTWGKIGPSQRWQAAPTEWRLAIAFAVVWAVGVVMFSVAFGNHGEYYRPEDEFWHVGKLAFVPALFGVFSFWLLRRAKRQ